MSVTKVRSGWARSLLTTNPGEWRPAAACSTKRDPQSWDRPRAVRVDWCSAMLEILGRSAYHRVREERRRAPRLPGPGRGPAGPGADRELGASGRRVLGGPGAGP